jgi:hypothetical protein
MNQYNNSYKQLTCPECGKLFEQPSLNYHRMLHHRIDLPVPHHTAERKSNAIERFIDRLLKSFQNPVREDIVLELCTIGVDAELLDRGLPEEESAERSLGMILIRGSPIRWINVGLETVVKDNGSYAFDYLQYAIPDSRPLPRFLVSSKFKRTFTGLITDVWWEGDKEKLGIAEKLESNEYIIDVLVSYGAKIQVITDPQYGCWIINGGILDWRCLELIAECLLRVPLK